MSSSTENDRTGAKQQRMGTESLTARFAPLLDGPVEPLLRELRDLWENGERRSVESFLDQQPQCRENSESLIALIYEEFCLRQELGEAVAADEYFGRFPDWQNQLAMLFQCHELVEPQAHVEFPEVGERLGEFRLLAELGRGAQGQVYLASQPMLGDRLVVLKVTQQTGGEYLLLSGLQHTHIVPLYCVLEEHERGLSAFCMPYVGGATLEQILASLRARPAEHRSGKDILAVLQQHREFADANASLIGRSSNFLDKASYTRAIAWIGACLAEALAYMHDRGLLHMDLKPSNVLIAGDGQPMLIDFHLAREPLKAGAKLAGRLGGTKAYMSPEQRRAIDAVLQAQAIPADVDHRSDIYSLGLVLYEALSDVKPDGRRPHRLPLAKLNPHVSIGLSDIIERCLADDPGDRYPSASSLAADLQAHLVHSPLRVAGNRSVAERFHKWRRRRPYGPALFAMMLLVVVGASGSCLLGWWHVRDRVSLAESRLVEADLLDSDENYDGALRMLRQALRETEGLPGTGDVRRQLAEKMKGVEQHKLAGRLSDLVDQLRQLDGFEDVPPEQVAALYDDCLEVWQMREQIQVSASTPPKLAQALQIDLLDLGILLASLRGRLTQDVAAHREALQILDATERRFGDSVVLQVHRSCHADAAGLAEIAEAARRRAAGMEPRSAWEHLALGRWQLGQGQLTLAAGHFQSATELKPEAFWPHFYQAVCAFRLEQYSRADHELEICIALSPERAECYYNRALTLAALGLRDDALRNLDRALELSANVEAALHKRAVLQKLELPHR